jgi:hypothetical protein
MKANALLLAGLVAVAAAAFAASYVIAGTAGGEPAEAVTPEPASTVPAIATGNLPAMRTPTPSPTPKPERKRHREKKHEKKTKEKEKGGGSGHKPPPPTPTPTPIQTQAPPPPPPPTPVPTKTAPTPAPTEEVIHQPGSGTD